MDQERGECTVICVRTEGRYEGNERYSLEIFTGLTDVGAAELIGAKQFEERKTRREVEYEIELLVGGFKGGDPGDDSLRRYNIIEHSTRHIEVLRCREREEVEAAARAEEEEAAAKKAKRAAARLRGERATYERLKQKFETQGDQEA